MRPPLLARLTISSILFSLVWATTAQNDACPKLVETALSTVGEACSSLGRNQACYGNSQITALDFDSAPLPDFSQSGDTTNVTSIASLATTALDVETDVWGVALLALQADLPDTLPGQNVTFVVFGETELTNEVNPVDQAKPPPTLHAEPTGVINVRGGPGTGYGVVGSLAAGDDLTLTGRNEAADWARIEWDSPSAWVFVPLLTLEGDVSTLQVTQVGADADSRYAMPMQTFRFSTGIGVAACEEVPESGILVQAPSDTIVHFRINGIEVEVGSTALLQSEGDLLGVNTFDGTVSVTSAGETQTAEPGFRIQASSDTAPKAPEPYDYALVQHAPVNLLPEVVGIPIAILGTSEWVNAGITVASGQTFTIAAGGGVDSCVNFADQVPDLCGRRWGPTGMTSQGTAAQADPDRADTYPMPNEALVALIGRIGNGGEPFYVGDGGIFVADRAGTLQFMPNDFPLNNNEGAFTVVIEVAEEE